MDQRTAEIKQANKKAFPKFILFLLASCLAGGVIGFVAALGRDGMGDTLARAAAFFGHYIAPCLMVASPILRPALCVPCYQSAKKLVSDWDGEDEAAEDLIEQKLTRSQQISSALSIAEYFLFGAVFSVGFDILADGHYLIYFACVVLFFLSMAESIMLSRRAVDLFKQLQPEKNGSVYDLNFQKKWLDSCDEAEKLLMGQCAMKAYTATQYTCLTLWLVAVLSALLLDTGLFPVLLVCVIWAVSLFTYNYYAKKLARPGCPIR